MMETYVRLGAVTASRSMLQKEETLSTTKLSRMEAAESYMIAPCHAFVFRTSLCCVLEGVRSKLLDQPKSLLPCIFEHVRVRVRWPR
jgi:hypothetical protein